MSGEHNLLLENHQTDKPKRATLLDEGEHIARRAVDAISFLRTRKMSHAALAYAYAAAAVVLIVRARSQRLRPPPVRSAEKDRKSTCAFADRVAQCAIEAFDRLCAAAGVEYRQTVCAAIVAVDRRAGGAKFSVVALGVGTKFLRAAQISADGGAGRVVRDCHAEVLARRAFKRFLCAELRRCVERGGGGLLRPPSDSGGRFGVAARLR